MEDHDKHEELSPSHPESELPLSKNAQKRLLKRQRWEDGKAERRAHKKYKLKEKKEALKLTGQRLPRKVKAVVPDQETSGIRVVVDCAFDNMMSEKVSYYSLKMLIDIRK